MVETALYVLISVTIASLVSLVGAVSLVISKSGLNKILLIMVSLSAGTLFGGAFLHLLPKIVEKLGFTLPVSLLVLGGIISFFLLESILHQHLCEIPLPRQYPLLHEPHKHKPHKHKIGILNLVGDGVHNFIDGLVIAGAYLISIPTGIATTIAVILHEVPQELADFGVLIYSGFSKAKALFFNFLSAATAILGALVGLILGSRGEMFALYLLPFAAGIFIYIAGANLIPELHKQCGWKESFWHLLSFLLGIAIMIGLLFLE